MSNELYQSDIKALAQDDSTAKSLPDPDRRVSLDNPFCGDRVDLEVDIQDGRISALAHSVRGCMLCQASANAMASSAIGLSLAEIEAIHSGLVAMLKGQDNPEWPPSGWESLALFQGVGPHKSRHGCVTLPLTALQKALP